MLMVLAFTTVSAVLGKSTLRGMTALFIGLAIGLHRHGPDLGPAALHHGQVPELMDGIEIVLVAVGLFAVAEVLYAVLLRRPGGRKPEQAEQVHMTGRDWKRSVAGLAARHRHRLSVWHHSRRRHRDTHLPELRHRKEAGQSPRNLEFGTTGAIEGVAGPEAANNATMTATLIPLLTLGIPTSNTTAILLGAFQNYGIQPGPQLFTRRPRWCGR
jgi:putative tricarboxylic transport membrane protein